MHLGLDIGTQSVKALILDPALKAVGRGSSPLTYQALPGGGVEQGAELWLDALGPAISSALGEAGLTPGGISSIGVGGQLDGCVPADGQGRPLHPCLIWMDRRAGDEIGGVSRETIMQRCGIVRDATHMAAKIAWFHQQRPDIYAATAMFHQPVSFVVNALTGQAVMDRALASTTMLYDLAARRFTAELGGLFGVDVARLPRLAAMSDLAGHLSASGAARTGLPRGLPVAVGTGDDFANAIGAGVTRPGAMLCQIGTGEVVGAIHGELVTDRAGFVETHEFSAGSYFIENPGWLSGGAVAWLTGLLRLSGVEEFNALAAAVPPGADGVVFLPALTGAMAPQWNGDVHACFHNLRVEHGPGHLCRAVLEGTAFAMRDVQSRLSGMGVEFSHMVLAGGGSSSGLWAKIRADVAQLPARRCRFTDAAPLGAAILGAVASGALASIDEALPALQHYEPDIVPCPARRDLYAEAHANYRALYASLATLAMKPAPDLA